MFIHFIIDVSHGRKEKSWLVKEVCRAFMGPVEFDTQTIRFGDKATMFLSNISGFEKFEPKKIMISHKSMLIAFLALCAGISCFYLRFHTLFAAFIMIAAAFCLFTGVRERLPQYRLYGIRIFSNCGKEVTVRSFEPGRIFRLLDMLSTAIKKNREEEYNVFIEKNEVNLKNATMKVKSKHIENFFANGHATFNGTLHQGNVNNHFASLREKLQQYNIPSQAIGELTDILQQEQPDREAGNSKPGPKASAWISRIIAGGIDVTKDILISIITSYLPK